ncbi:MAG: glycosyltransferase family 1 protein [Opitutales bacterium]|jgi:glycosyltransferase involved in cell wall biosynthesis
MTLVLELTHTSHTLAATGIQQVCRNLFAELKAVANVDVIVLDPWQRSWRRATYSERERLVPGGDCGVARRKGEAWTAAEKLRGRLKMLAGIKGTLPSGNSAILFPEFIMGRCVKALPGLRRRLGPDVPFVAIFHDAIAMRMPEFSALKTVARMPEYIAALAGFDAVAAVSEASRQELLFLWDRMGMRETPPVEVIPPGIRPPEQAGRDLPHSIRAAPRVLCVATLEPRKNHQALLDAAEQLWAEGLEFELELAGMAHREMGAIILARIRELEGRGRKITWHGAVDDATLHALYEDCDFTAYCSLMEGFGLPVAESLAHGRPCVCTTCGALDEVSRGGGCLRLDGTDAACVAEGLRRMLSDKALRGRLVAEAAAKPVRSWADYAMDVLDWARGSRRRC